MKESQVFMQASSSEKPLYQKHIPIVTRSVNLTDNIWLWADVAGAASEKEKVALLTNLINAGVNRGVMPAWSGRLSADQIKLLTVYVHDSLGGGK